MEKQQAAFRGGSWPYGGVFRGGLSTPSRGDRERCKSGLLHLLVHVLSQVFDDEVLTVRGVLAHVEGEQFLHAFAFLILDMVEAHVRADHEAELVGRDFSEALEAGDLGGLAEKLERIKVSP